MHRRMLQEASSARFSPAFTCTITDFKEFGKATLYRILTKYKYHRSLVYFRYSEFDRLNTLVTKLLRRSPSTSALAEKMPKMPAKGISTFGTSSESLRCNRRNQLERYINDLFNVVKGIQSIRCTCCFSRFKFMYPRIYYRNGCRKRSFGYCAF